MSQVWGESGGGDLQGRRGRRTAGDARSQYQRKELELEEEREALSTLLSDERRQKEERTRVKRDRGRKVAELAQLEQRERTLERDAEDLEHRITQQKSRIATLERQVNAGRDEAHRKS
ncbi:MAG: hypothetical protein G01um1014106_170 [Parcubacteria group bacterium Gr01-1014_106]|nr:MAG: hypothetical protein G01um1014106_170 [Parcubacteria group bacterium Gr01-1014_106]